MMMKCPNGHPDYDDRFLSSCPKCYKVDSVPNSPPPRMSPEPAAAPPKSAAADRKLGITQLDWDSAITGPPTANTPRERIDPVTGWLVATKGPQRGKTYPLFRGKNSVGRDPAAKIFIADQGISEEIAFTLTYDFRKFIFSVAPAGTRGLVHVERRQRCFYDPKDGTQLLSLETALPLDVEKHPLGLVELEHKVELTPEWHWYIHVGNSVLKFAPFCDENTLWVVR